MQSRLTLRAFALTLTLNLTLNLVLIFTSSSLSAATSIEESLAAVAGLSFVEVKADPKTPEGYRRFDLQYEQPVDHQAPEAAKFRQKLVLLHRGVEEPMVLQTSGYSIRSVSLTGIAKNFETNQIQVEHRFFAGSIPSDPDWTKLDIVQSAADFHRITQAFRAIYSGKWVNTGASKGGMTSVFHRRFYPHDLDGTLAYVAPLSFSLKDDRYPIFVDRVGDTKWAECRLKLEELQKGLLEHRAEIVKDLKGNFKQLGSADIAFEHAIIELPFVFWQYKSPTAADVGCSVIPERSASSATLAKYLEEVNSMSGYTDESIANYIPYYFQAANQLGAPANKTEHLVGLLDHDGTFELSTYIPHDLPLSYSNTAMQDISQWVKNQSENIMFVYGEFDPWTAGPFVVNSDAASDSFFYTQPMGNHGSNVFSLAPSDKAMALQTLARWLGKNTKSLNLRQKLGRTLEDEELEMRHSF